MVRNHPRSVFLSNLSVSVSHRPNYKKKCISLNTLLDYDVEKLPNLEYIVCHYPEFFIPLAMPLMVISNASRRSSSSSTGAPSTRNLRNNSAKIDRKKKNEGG